MPRKILCAYWPWNYLWIHFHCCTHSEYLAPIWLGRREQLYARKLLAKDINIILALRIVFRVSFISVLINVCNVRACVCAFVDEILFFLFSVFGGEVAAPDYCNKYNFIYIHWSCTLFIYCYFRFHQKVFVGQPQINKMKWYVARSEIVIVTHYLWIFKRKQLK